MKLQLLTKKIIDHRTDSLSLLKLLLHHRQISSKDIASFLRPPEPHFKVPKLKIGKLDQILIYGDYDVDGLTATAILWQSLFLSGYQVTPFIPHRQTDGYGFKAKSFFRFQEQKNLKFNCLITVDNGIMAQPEFKRLKIQQPDIKIIVIDHHLAGETLPLVDQIIHSPQMCGAALAYFASKKFTNLADIGLAALGTVADCLPLIGINRSLVVHGLQSLRLNPSPGIKKIIELSGIKTADLSASDLGFVIGPRLNAVGRLTDATDALRLLCSQNSQQAVRFAQSLNQSNQDRQDIQKISLENADKQIDLKNKLIFISGDYHPGIIGLIAGRLTEKYYLPSIIISQNKDVSKGSCRSIPELNIIESLRRYSKLFIDLGGHAQAAGFSLLTDNIPKLKTNITKTINRQLTGINLIPTIKIDAEMKLSAVTSENIKTINQLAPFGIGNPEPVFLFKKLKIVQKKVLGSNGDHLKLRLDNVDAIAFKKGELAKTLNVGDNIDVVAHLSLNVWNGTSTPQLIVKEIIKA